MTRQEFTKFIKGLKKEELVKIILNLTSRKKDLQEKIYYEYSPKSQDIEINYDRFVDELFKIDRQVFNKSFMFIGSAEVGKFCRSVNKLISSYVEPLIKTDRYYEAFKLLQETFYYTFESLGISLYKYSSSQSFFNKLEKDFDKIFQNVQGYELVRIEKLINENIHRDPDLMFDFCMNLLVYEYFPEEEWEKEKEEILIKTIDSYLKEFNPNEPAPDQLSECTRELLDLKIKRGDPQEDLNEFVQKYNYLGDIARFEAEKYLKEEDPDKALEYLQKAQELPTMSTEQLVKNSNLLIKILVKKNHSKEELKKELKHNLDNYVQKEASNLFRYLFLLDRPEQKRAFDYYAQQPTTQILFLDREMIDDYFELIQALSIKDYEEIKDFKSEFVLTLAGIAPNEVGEFMAFKVRKAMASGTRDKDYREADEALRAIYAIPELRDYYDHLKQELIDKYPNRSKLKGILDAIPAGKASYY